MCSEKTLSQPTFFAIANNRRIDLSSIQDEYRSSNCVAWEVTGNGNKHLEEGQSCIFYYGGLPNGAEGRILFRGTISHGVHDMTRDMIYRDGDPTVVSGFVVGNLEILDPMVSEKYVYSNLKSKYGITNIRNPVQQLQEHHQMLLEDLDADFRSCSSSDLSALIEYFDQAD